MNNTEKRLCDIETILRMLVEERRKLSRIGQLWNRWKSHLIPFILGMILGGVAANCLLPSAQPTLEQQAALGGAAIPFPSGSPSPMLSTSPPEISEAESTASSLMNISEPPLPPSPPAESGQMNSQRSFRRTSVRMR
jgi:hypothetical protein